MKLYAFARKIENDGENKERQHRKFKKMYEEGDEFENLDEFE